MHLIESVLWRLWKDRETAVEKIEDSAEISMEKRYEEQNDGIHKRNVGNLKWLVSGWKLRKLADESEAWKDYSDFGLSA